MNYHVGLLRALVRMVFRDTVISVAGEAGRLWMRPAEYPSLLLGPRRVERDIAHEWKALLQPGEVILDIGANIGFTVQRFHALLDGNCRIWGFEPLLRNVELLERNVKHLGEAVTVVTAALGDRDGVAVLTDNRRHGGLSRLHGLEALPSEQRDFWKATLDVEVPLMMVDTYVQARPELRPSFIKVDVEGAGHWVMHGARQTLERNRPLVSCSFHSDEEREGILEVLAQQGYRGVSIDASGGCRWCDLDRSTGNFLHPLDERRINWRERSPQGAQH